MGMSSVANGAASGNRKRPGRTRPPPWIGQAKAMLTHRAAAKVRRSYTASTGHAATAKRKALEGNGMKNGKGLTRKGQWTTQAKGRTRHGFRTALTPRPANHLLGVLEIRKAALGHRPSLRAGNLLPSFQIRSTGRSGGRFNQRLPNGPLRNGPLRRPRKRVRRFRGRLEPIVRTHLAAPAFTSLAASLVMRQRRCPCELTSGRSRPSALKVVEDVLAQRDVLGVA